MYVHQKYTDLKAIYWQHHARLGAPSLTHDMHDLGYCISERKLEELGFELPPVGFIFPTQPFKNKLDAEQIKIGYFIYTPPIE